MVGKQSGQMGALPLCGWGAQSMSLLAEGDMFQPEEDVGAARGYLSRWCGVPGLKA
jgi:hypothetical protein